MTVLVDGGIYSFKYPYATFSISKSANVFFGPKVIYGPTNATGEFPFAPVVAVSGPTIPLVSIVALIGAVICFVLESDLPLFSGVIPASLHERHSSFKAVLYGLLGLYTINQFTIVQPATFLIVASIFLFYDACAGKPNQSMSSKSKV
jgi:hypothetical protein